MKAVFKKGALKISTKECFSSKIEEQNFVFIKLWKIQVKGNFIRDFIP